MKKTIYLLLFILFYGIQHISYCQPLVNFILPDSSCVGTQINITNLTTGGSTFYWNFCSGNANTTPSGINIGNPGNLLNVPTYITLVKDNNNCYSFISCQFAGIIRYNLGSSFGYYPISWTDLGTFRGLLGNHIEGIQIKKDNGNWYGFVCDYTTLVRLDFGSSLANTPTAMDLGPFTGLVMLHGLDMIKYGTTWVGFATCSTGDKLVRFNFGNSLSNIPTLTDFGNFGVLTSPGALCILEDNLLWYGFIADNDLVRLTFGNSLINTPTAVNLGLSGVDGLTLLRDCDSVGGYYTDYNASLIYKLLFPLGLTGSVTSQLLGNIGNLSQPHSFSELFRLGDTLFAYLTERGSNTITKLTFSPCDNSSVLSSTHYNPPPFSYNQPGSYNIRLLVDEGQPGQFSLCKTITIGSLVSNSIDTTICFGEKYLAGGAMQSTSGIYYDTLQGSSSCDTVKITHLTVKPRIPVNLGRNRSICPGDTIILDSKISGASYVWQNLTTDSSYVVTKPGTYWVHINYKNCSGGDTIVITECPGELWFPSAFTPNGDGVNDLFRPKGNGITNYHLMIYSRWGQFLFETYDLNVGWDGSSKGSLCPSGTYTFSATFTGKENPQKTSKKIGTFVLLR